MDLTFQNFNEIKEQYNYHKWTEKKATNKF